MALNDSLTVEDVAGCRLDKERAVSSLSELLGACTALRHRSELLAGRLRVLPPSLPKHITVVSLSPWLCSVLHRAQAPKEMQKRAGGGGARSPR